MPNWVRPGAILLSTVVVSLALQGPASAGGWAQAPGALLNQPARHVCPHSQVVRPSQARCASLIAVNARTGQPLAYASPPGYNPADFWSAYSLPAQTASTWEWNGQTVAIVDAYDDPNASQDLSQYRSQFGLSACTAANGCFVKVNQRGRQIYPRFNEQWALEISLDIEMVSALCSGCRIVLVETKSNSFTDLMAGVDEAYAENADEISNSWGTEEFSGETAYDSHFARTAGAGRSAVVTASSGDSAYPHLWYPAASPYVNAIGGTALSFDSVNGWSESGWVDAGSGCSPYERQPAWQAGIQQIASSCGWRAGADVAFDAVIASVYDSAGYQGQTGWFAVSGTSIGSPAIASIYALAGNSSTAVAGSYPYAHLGGLFDVTGNYTCSGGGALCTPGAGWDGPTGLGTPRGTSAF